MATFGQLLEGNRATFWSHWRENILLRGHGDVDLVVSVLALYSDDPSSDPNEDYSLSLKGFETE